MKGRAVLPQGTSLEGHRDALRRTAKPDGLEKAIFLLKYGREMLPGGKESIMLTWLRATYWNIAV